MEAKLQIAMRDSKIATRPYVVVNPLLGKHIPARPSEVLSYFEQLATVVEATCLGERVLVIGFAETATAIGAAVAASVKNSIYVHTTREELNSFMLITEFLEGHSHARNQALYLTELYSDLLGYDRIVFVEDEITTGKTIINFLKNIQWKGKITVSALVFNGFDETVFQDYDAQFCCVQKFGYCQKLDYTGIENPRLGALADVYKQTCVELAKYIYSQVDVANKDILVLGTEEFMYPAIITGKELEKTAKNVKTQSTTRSPLLTKTAGTYPLNSKAIFSSVYDSKRETYLYNLERYDEVIVITDSQSAAESLLLSLQSAGNQNITLVRVCYAD